MLPDKKNYITTINGKQTELFILKNQKGMSAAITNYGGRVVTLNVPDKNGNLVDVVVGYALIGQYDQGENAYYGALIGRYGNRIGGGRFSIDGRAYTLFRNNGPNTLHGGRKGFDAAVWEAKQIDDQTLELTHLSPDGDEGFPGNLRVKVTYTLTDDNGLQCAYEATTDQPTVLNLTNHAYFNLNGVGNGSIGQHLVQINADRYTPVDEHLIPTGVLAPVAGTPFDFTTPHTIGERIDDQDQQLIYGAGYDHNYVLNRTEPNTMVQAALVTGDLSGIRMEVFTTEPGMQFYTGNHMKGQNTLINGTSDPKRSAFAMETQHFPDSPNKPEFPTTRLNPDETFRSRTEYRFQIVS